jgi:hypothetical protein
VSLAPFPPRTRCRPGTLAGTRRIRLLLACLPALICIAALAPSTAPRLAAATAAGHTYVVTSTIDAPDFDPIDGICASVGHGCTLRAAIDQANHGSDLDTIIVPAGTFLLTRVGIEDLNLTGDLDILHSMSILGAGPGATIIDGNGAVTDDGVFQILSSAITTTLSGMTIRNGRNVTNSHPMGGGIFWMGGAALALSNLRLENNQATNGGGIFLWYLNAASVTLDHLTVQANHAGSGGGLMATLHGGTSGFDLRSSQFISNSAGVGGGLDILDEQSSPTPLFGRIQQSEFYSNTAVIGGGMELQAGDAYHTLNLVDSRVHDNAGASYGGGIVTYQSLSLLRSEVVRNQGGQWGGGIFSGGVLTLAQSTVWQNTAVYGAGVYAISGMGNPAQTTLLNSTLSSNYASRQGGGLYAASGAIQSSNSTIAANRIDIPIGQTGFAAGAGILLTTNAAYPLNLWAGYTTRNTILAGNVTSNPRVGEYEDDCYGIIDSQGYNLIGKMMPFCGYAHSSGTDIVNLDPKLGPPQFNGGATPTQALLPGSPAIDAGDPAGCADASNAPIPTDQRGFRRPIGARCDIGAFEYSPFALMLPLVRR